MKSLLPLLVVVLGGAIYQTTLRKFSSQYSPFLQLSCVYAAACIFCIVSYAFSGSTTNPISKIHWSFLLLAIGVCLVEFGYILAYSSGSALSSFPVQCLTAGTVILILMGTICFSEHFSWRQFFGITLCIAGVFLLQTKK